MISEYTMRHSLPYRIQYEVRGFEIHVRNPEGKQLIGSEKALHAVILDGVRSPAVYRFIEVVFHRSRPLSAKFETE